jgi:hypothetical protein
VSSSAVPKKTSARLSAASHSVPLASSGDGEANSSMRNSTVAAAAVASPPVSPNQKTLIMIGISAYTEMARLG